MIEFPVSAGLFFETLRVATNRFHLEEYVEISRTSDGVVVNEIMPPRWRAEFTLSNMPPDEASVAAAMMRRIGAAGTFNAWDMDAEFPRKDPTGSILGSNVVTINNVNSGRVSLAGLPDGYKLTAGDRFHVSYSSRRGYFEIAESVTANGSGITPAFDVNPRIKVGVTAGLVVDLKKPTARMRFLSYDPGTGQMKFRSGMSFSAIEA